MSLTANRIDFTDKATQACPFAAYADINEVGGVAYDAATRTYVVTGYELVRKLTADNVNLSSQTGLTGLRDSDREAECAKIYAEKGIAMRDVLVSSDPPDHLFQRSLVDKIFTPRRVATMEPYLGQLVEKCIDDFIDAGEVEFHGALSLQVPMTVIADQLGLPRTEDDLARFKLWTDAIAARADTNVGREEMIALVHTVCELQQFIIRKAAEYRENPADCILSDLVHADVDGRRLDLEELVSMVKIILVAGNETTTNALSNGMLRLAERPELQERLRENPRLIPKFVEEILRLDAPVQGMFRRALSDIKVGDVDIPKGAIIVLKWGAANRDARKFEQPEEVDIDRPNLRQHLTFGFGPHFCVGNQLARVELRVVFEQVLDRMINIRLADRPDAVTRRPHFVTYGLEKLHLSFERCDQPATASATAAC